MNKEVLRKEYLDRRKRLDSIEWVRRNSALHEHFFDNIKLEKITSVHMFLPMVERMEPDTWQIITQLQKKHPEIRIIISRTVWKDHSLEHYVFENRAQLEVNRYGIPEPVSGTRVDNSEIDMVVVPLLVVDKRGHRIGYGGGFYDRFLAKLGAHVFKVGFSLANPIEIDIETEPHDIPLNACICPAGFFEF